MLISQSRELGPRWCEQLGHQHSVLWLQDILCEAAVTDEPWTGKYVPSGVPDVLVFISYGAKELWIQFHPAQDITLSLLVSGVTGECKPIMDMPW